MKPDRWFARQVKTYIALVGLTLFSNSGLLAWAMYKGVMKPTWATQMAADILSLEVIMTLPAMLLFAFTARWACSGKQQSEPKQDAP